MIGKRVLMFSYGSGSLATAFALYPRVPSAAQNPQFTCQAIADTIDLHARLSARAEMSPAEFSAALLLRETTHGMAPYVPSESVETVAPGAFYIDEINSSHHRIYAQRPLADEVRSSSRPARPPAARAPVNRSARAPNPTRAHGSLFRLRHLARCACAGRGVHLGLELSERHARCPPAKTRGWIAALSGLRCGAHHRRTAAAAAGLESVRRRRALATRPSRA